MAEIAALEAVLGERAAGPAPVVAVHGEAGIGKTSLVAQYVARAADRGSTVLWGACYEDSSHAKIGARNRAEASAYTVRHGL